VVTSASGGFVQSDRRRALTTALALLSVAAVTGTVFLVAAGPQRGSAAATPADARCVTAAFPGETETIVPTPSTAATTLFPTVPPVVPTSTVVPGLPDPAGWTGTWGTALQDLSERLPSALTNLAGQTLRQVVHPTIGGTGFRIRLANTFGTEPLRLSAVTAAISVGTGRPGLRAGTVHPVTFGGSPEIEIPPGGRVISDPVDQAFASGQSLAIDLVPQGPAPTRSGHSRSASTSYLASGDRAGQVGGTGFGRPVRSWFWLEGVDVPDPAGTGSISTFGDSITEGMWSTPDTDRRWPDLLAVRLRAAGTPMGLLNEGIGGNRVVSENLACASPSASGLRRFDRDVLSRPDVRVVVLALGINDIGRGTPASTAIDGLKTLAARAHERGLWVVGATLTPFTCTGGCLSPEKEQQRELVNDWIRTTPDLDARVDFAAALADPADEDRMRAAYDSGDHLHPSDAGMRSMESAFDLPALVGP
jgi:lysophospholipase L1-like esterase